MLWVDGTPTIYNGYQDLSLLDPNPRSASNIVSPVIEKDVEKQGKDDSNFTASSPVDSPILQIEENLQNISDDSASSTEINSPSINNNASTLLNSNESISDKETNSEKKEKPDRSSISLRDIFQLKSSSSNLGSPSQPTVQPFTPIERNIPIDRGILMISMDPLCEWFVTLTMSSVELWSVKPTMLLCQVTRSTDSVVSEGAYVDISWKLNSKSFCVFTARGFIYFYDIGMKDGVVSKTSPVFDDNYGTLGSCLSEVLHPSTQTNPHSSWIRNPGRFFSLILSKTIEVEGGVRCFMSLDDEILVATPNNASLLNYSWKDKVMLGSLHLAQDAKHFLNPANVMVNQMCYDSLQKMFAWLTTDGSVYLVRRKISFSVFASGSPYEWQGVQAHRCDGNPETYATMIAVNPRHHLVAAVMRKYKYDFTQILKLSNMIYIYSYGKSGLVVRFSHKFKVNSQVTCLAWSSSGETLAIGTASKGLQLYGVYNCTPDLITSQGRFGFGKNSDPNDDPYSLCVHCLSWGAGDQELLVVSNTSTFQKGKLYSLPICRTAIISQMTDDNIRCPTLFGSSKITLDFFVQTEHGSINPNALSHSTQIPYTYGLDNLHIRYLSRSGDGLFLAVAGRRGLTHYSCISQKWKLFNNHAQEQSFHCVGGMVWFQNTLIVGCKLADLDNYYVKFFPREKNLDLSNVVCSLDLSAKPVYLNLVENWLLVYSSDNLLSFYDISTDNSGRISSVSLAQKISLEGVVKVPYIVRAITWFPANLRQFFPKMVILMAGSLLLFTPDVDSSAGLPKYRITQIADKVSHFQILNLSLAGLQFSLWAYCSGIVKMWYQLSELPGIFSPMHSTQESSSEMPLAFEEPQTLQVPFHPLTLDLKQGLIFGVEQSMHDSLQIPGLFFSPSFKSHVLFHPILNRLVKHSLDQEAYLFGLHFEPYPYFGYGLEILLHDVLVREAESHPAEIDAVLPRAVSLIKQFPHFPEVVVSCARKIEAALWGQLFAAVGPPIDLFTQCLAAHRHEAAASYLIVLHTLEPADISANASSRLLQRAIADQDLELFHNVARFVARIKNTTDPAFLSEYLQNSTLSEEQEYQPEPLHSLEPRPQSAQSHISETQNNKEATDSITHFPMNKVPSE